MKSAELVAKRSYAYVPPSAYKSRDARDPNKCRRSDLRQGTLVDTQQYPYNKDYTYSYSQASLPAPLAKGAKGTWGVLIQRVDGNFDIVRPVDIVGLWDVLDKRWTVAEAQAKALAEANERIAKINAEREIEERRLLEKRSEYVANQIQQLAPAVVGLKFEVQSASSYHNPTNKPRSIVTLSLDDFTHLIERMYEEIESR